MIRIKIWSINFKSSQMIARISSTNAPNQTRMVVLIYTVNIEYRIHENIVCMCNGVRSYWTNRVCDKVSFHSNQ